MSIPNRPPGSEAFFDDHYDEEMHVYLGWADHLGSFEQGVIEAAVTLAMYVEIPSADVTVYFRPAEVKRRIEHCQVVFPRLLASCDPQDEDNRGKAQRMIDAYIPRLQVIARRAGHAGLSLSSKLARGYPAVQTPKPRRSKTPSALTPLDMAMSRL